MEGRMLFHRHAAWKMIFISVFAIVVGCGTNKTTKTLYHGAQVYQYMIEECNSETHPMFSACDHMAKELREIDPVEATRLYSRSCELNAWGGCYGYLTFVGSHAAALTAEIIAVARQRGEELCRGGVYTSSGVDKSGKFCHVTATFLYGGGGNKTFAGADTNPAKAVELLKYGCRVGQYENACIALPYYDVEVDEGALQDAQRKGEENLQQSKEFYRAKDNEDRAREQQKDETFARNMQQLQQLNQALQSLPGVATPRGLSGQGQGAASAGQGSRSCNQCSGLKASCQSEGQRVCYEAAACLCDCYGDSKCAQENRASAARLNSNAPAVR
jgi:hypothetical protein